MWTLMSMCNKHIEDEAADLESSSSHTILRACAGGSWPGLLLLADFARQAHEHVVRGDDYLHSAMIDIS